MNNLAGIVNEEEQKIVLQTVVALEDFSRDESLKDDAKVWITKKEAYLLWSFIYGLLHKLYGSAKEEDNRGVH